MTPLIGTPLYRVLFDHKRYTIDMVEVISHSKCCFYTTGNDVWHSETWQNRITRHRRIYASMEEAEAFVESRTVKMTNTNVL